MGWQRARKPEQKRQRSDALLEAAAELFATEGYERVSLAAIADRAGVSKASIYRYFESKEAIFLRLLVGDTEAWVEAVEAALAPLAGSDDARAVGATIAQTLIARPRLCALMALAAGVLEHNVAGDAVIALKRRMLQLSIRGINTLHAAMPSLSIAAAQSLLRQAHCLVAGMWPAAHPPPPVAEALALPELAAMCVDFERDLPIGLVALLTGLAAPPATTPAAR